LQLPADGADSLLMSGSLDSSTAPAPLAGVQFELQRGKPKKGREATPQPGHGHHSDGHQPYHGQLGPRPPPRTPFVSVSAAGHQPQSNASGVGVGVLVGVGSGGSSVGEDNSGTVAGSSAERGARHPSSDRDTGRTIGASFGDRATRSGGGGADITGSALVLTVAPAAEGDLVEAKARVPALLSNSSVS
jgi:hypothetical protein